MKKIFPILLIFLSCTELLINNTEYHSIELKGNGWVQIDQGSNFNKNNFTFQTWFSGSDSIITSTQTIFSMVNSTGDILIGLFKDPINSNQLNIWLDNENDTTIEVTDILNDIDSFNLLTIKTDTTSNHSENPTLISTKFYINKTKILDKDTNLSIDKLDNVDFIVGGKVSSNPEDNYQGQDRDSFWHGCIDEIRFWNIALADSIIDYHNDYPDKLSFQSDSLTYINYLGHLDGLWRFYTNETAYFNVPNDACPTIERLYNDNPCSTDSEAVIYTIGDHQIEFSEKHK